MTFRHMTPGPEMDFVDGDGRTELLPLFALLHPVLVAPLVPMDICDDAGRLGSQFGGEAIGIGLIHRVVIETRVDGIFIEAAGLHSRHEAFPDTQVTVAQVHRRGLAIQSLKSPITETARALAAHTEKLTPATPSTVRRWAPIFS